MKPLLQTLLTVGLGFLAHYFFPFWAIAIVGGLVGLFFPYKNSLASFAAGFAAASMLWGGYATFLNSFNLQSLSAQLGVLFKIEGSYLIWATGWLGGMLGGLGAMTGSLARKIFTSEAEPTETQAA